jgi:hypothetical protein
MYAYQLRLEAEKNGMQNLFGLLNTGKEQAKKMSRLVQEVYANDGVLLDEFQNMAKATTLALNDVQSKLGPPGLMKAENVPAAAKLLGGTKRNSCRSSSKQTTPSESSAASSMNLDFPT